VYAMIPYNNKAFYRILLRTKGTVYRAILPRCLAAAMVPSHQVSTCSMSQSLGFRLVWWLRCSKAMGSLTPRALGFRHQPFKRSIPLLALYSVLSSPFGIAIAALARPVNLRPFARMSIAYNRWEEAIVSTSGLRRASRVQPPTC
jgi:hypothetical protein